MTNKQIWISRAISAVPVLILLASATMKFVRPPGFEDGMAHMGWPIEPVAGLAILEFACTVIYLIPRTAVLGAILLTGYLGGATATHVRVGDPYFLQPLLGAMLWGGLYLREDRLRALLPLTRR